MFIARPVKVKETQTLELPDTHQSKLDVYLITTGIFLASFLVIPAAFWNINKIVVAGRTSHRATDFPVEKYINKTLEPNLFQTDWLRLIKVLSAVAVTNTIKTGNGDYYNNDIVAYSTTNFRLPSLSLPGLVSQGGGKGRSCTKKRNISVMTEILPWTLPCQSLLIFLLCWILQRKITVSKVKSAWATARAGHFLTLTTNYTVQNIQLPI